MFGGRYDPDTVAVLTIAAADGMGIPLWLADPEITPAGAARDVMAVLREAFSARIRADRRRAAGPLLDVGDGLDRGGLRQRLGLG